MLQLRSAGAQLHLFFEGGGLVVAGAVGGAAVAVSLVLAVLAPEDLPPVPADRPVAPGAVALGAPPVAGAAAAESPAGTAVVAGGGAVSAAVTAAVVAAGGGGGCLIATTTIAAAIATPAMATPTPMMSPYDFFFSTGSGVES